jgi:hypothetical protein
MRGHGVRNHGEKDNYNEFHLYFEGHNLCGTVFNSEKAEVFRKEKFSARIKSIVVPKGIWNFHPLETKHLERLQIGDESSRQANEAAIRAYVELEKIGSEQKMKRFKWLNTILICTDLIADYRQMPSTVWQEAMDIALDKKDV